jgi:hypothetical protein
VTTPHPPPEWTYSRVKIRSWRSNRDVCFSNRPSGSSAFRPSTTTVSMSLAGSCFSSESSPGPLYGVFLYGVFFVKELARAAKLSFVGFLVRSQSPFLRPDLRIADVDARKICTRLAVTPTLRHASPLPGHTMTASSTTAR